MADLLATMSGKVGGLRSGPGSNKSWSTAFKYLLAGEIGKGMEELKCERVKWLDRPGHIMRAARHYERAVQILIQISVQTAKKYMTFSLVHFPALGSWVTVECPARIDLQGGWTDTPPVCYELGGSVVNIAVSVDGKEPIGAKACRKDELNVELEYGPKHSRTTLIIENMEEILDFDQPYAQGALLKAALVCANIVDTRSDLTLKQQLLKNCKSGIIVHAWSNLPQGCGMGTSSILAAAIIAVLWSVSGRKFDKSAIIHAVLYTEQLLTTGGGWQDQVGGVMGGINRGFCRSALPLHVEVNEVSVNPSVLEKLNQHLLLIYTGKVRLAKNILQSVIRNWYARDSAVVNCFQDLISSSLEMEEALLEGNLHNIGSLMNRYWKQKKVLAPGCEPSSVKTIMDTLEPVSYGQILAGAGGGGIMCVLTKEPNAKDLIRSLLCEAKVSDSVTLHSATVHARGLTITL